MKHIYLAVCFVFLMVLSSCTFSRPEWSKYERDTPWIQAGVKADLYQRYYDLYYISPAQTHDVVLRSPDDTKKIDFFKIGFKLNHVLYDSGLLNEWEVHGTRYCDLDEKDRSSSKLFSKRKSPYEIWLVSVNPIVLILKEPHEEYSRSNNYGYDYTINNIEVLNPSCLGEGVVHYGTSIPYTKQFSYLVPKDRKQIMHVNAEGNNVVIDSKSVKITMKKSDAQWVTSREK